jgi:hypothetical protein
MPAITPLKPWRSIAVLRPSVLRAAERAAGGREASMVSIGGQSTLKSLRFHSAA